MSEDIDEELPFEECQNCCICNEGTWELGVCILCHHKGGAMKQTTDYKWCHICCALWIPEVFFHEATGRDAIDYFQINKNMKETKCIYCNIRGVCQACSEVGCKNTFHVSCGLRNDVLLEYKLSSIKGQKDIIVSFCGSCSAEAKKKKNWKMKFYAKK